MPTRNPASTANVMGHPLHPILITLPIGFFVATLVFDLMFWRTGTESWARGALWLLGAGLIAAALAAVAGLIDFTGDARIRQISDAWQHAIGNVCCLPGGKVGNWSSATASPFTTNRLVSSAIRFGDFD